MRSVWRVLSLLLVCAVGPAGVQAALTASQVLVVYNSQSTDAQTVLNAYLAAHPDIPAANVFDLNSTVIANTADITYANFITYIRNPIRTYLDLAGDPTPNGIVSICLIRGIPHRILDTDNALVGDNPSSTGTEANAGDLTNASVDSELVLLWQNLETGEAGGTMDSHSDNMIDNPYHMSTTEIGSFSRSNIKVAKAFTNYIGFAWKYSSSGTSALKPGDMYLVSRVDGNNIADTVAMITRAADLRVNRKYAWVILDEDAINDYDNTDLCGTTCSPPLFTAGPDYENTRDHMTSAGWNVLYDNTATFITPLTFTLPIIAYASYGRNHNPMPSNPSTYIEGFLFAPGAMFNTTESYNGRALNGLGTLYSQEQVADFIHAGGTFGIGQVWEPFSFSLPDNDYMVQAMLVRGMSWAEAAWTSIPCLSWMHVVIGDPLAKVVQVADQPGDFNADVAVDDLDLQYFSACAIGPALGSPTGDCTRVDLNADGGIDMLDFAAMQRCLRSVAAPLNPSCAN